MDHKDAPEKDGMYSFNGYTYKKPVVLSEATSGSEESDYANNKEKLKDHNDEFVYDTASFFYNVRQFDLEEDWGNWRDPYDEVFLKKAGKCVFLADKLTIEEAKEKFDQDHKDYVPFFAIHGYNTEASFHMSNAMLGNKWFAQIEQNFDKTKKKKSNYSCDLAIAWSRVRLLFRPRSLCS